MQMSEHRPSRSAACTCVWRACWCHAAPLADQWRFCLADLILFTATANTSIVTLNLSLLLNKVGFYQVGFKTPIHCLSHHSQHSA